MHVLMLDLLQALTELYINIYHRLYSMGKVTWSQCDIALSFSLQGVRMGGWFSPSFIAVIVSLLVWWLAYMTKNKLQE